MNYAGITIRKNKSGGPTRIDRVAAAMWRLQEATVGDLARESGATENTCYHAMSRLQKRGFVTRERIGDMAVFFITGPGRKYCRAENYRLELRGEV